MFWWSIKASAWRSASNLDHFGDGWLLIRQAVQGVVEREQFVGCLVRGEVNPVQVDPIEAAGVADARLAPGVLDEDAPHGLGRRAEEVAAAVPRLCIVMTHQAQVRFVDQGRRLKSLAGFLPGETGGGQLAEFLVDQRQEPVGGAGVALFDRFEDPRHFVHG